MLWLNVWLILADVILRGATVTITSSSNLALWWNPSKGSVTSGGGSAAVPATFGVYCPVTGVEN